MGSIFKSQFNVSTLTPVDADAAADLVSQTLGYDKQVALERLTADHPDGALQSITLKAMFNGTLVGVAQGVHISDHDHLKSRHWCNIRMIAVADDHRHQGIGTELLAAIEKDIAAQWIKYAPGEIGVIDETKQQNPQSSFFEKNGYIPVISPGVAKTVLIKSFNN